MQKIELKLDGEDSFLVQEAYKVLRTNLMFCGQDIRVIAITSCNENEGKTTVCLNIAKSLAELNKKVLVVDADMRKSVMAGRNTNAQNVVGLSELLTGMCEYTDCICKTQYDTLQIVFAGQYPPNPVELLNGKHFISVLDKFREYYDYVLIDTPPLGAVIDAAVISSHCDGTVLVLGDKNVHRREMQDVIDQLKKTDSNILGVVRNNTSGKDHSGYYYRKKNYGYYKDDDSE